MKALQPHLPLFAIFIMSAILVTGCTRRQLAPGIVAGTGAILTTSGGIYRATLDTEEAFGGTPGEVAGTTVLLFGGLGLLLTGIIWSITASHCDDNGDCWSGSVCQRGTHTCIRRSAADDESQTSDDSTPSTEERADEAADERTDEAEDEVEEEETEEEVPASERPYPG